MVVKALWSVWSMRLLWSREPARLAPGRPAYRVAMWMCEELVTSIAVFAPSCASVPVFWSIGCRFDIGCPLRWYYYEA
jgi:hypothetical protein